MNSWIPYPVAVVWTVAFATVAVVHLGHAVVMGWRHRVWHAGHVLMAVGMLVMFWPAGSLLGIPAAAGVWVYALASGVLTLGLIIAWWNGVRLGLLWLVSVVDFAVMAYMFAMMSARLAWLSVLAGAWLIAQAIGWASGSLGGVLERGGLGEPIPAIRTGPPFAPPDGGRPQGESREAWADDAATPSEPAAATGSESTGVVTVAARMATAVRRVVIDGGRHDWSVRITLTVMAAGMGYMILAMQFGMPAMGGMDGM